jgi:CAAX protease family protein
MQASSAHSRASPVQSTLGFWIPMVVFGVLTLAEGYVPLQWYPIAYIVKALLVTTCLVFYRRPLADIKFDARLILPSMILGIAVFVIWIWLDKFVSYPHLGARTAFDPTQLSGSWWFGVFLCVRFYGLALMVPVMEEIFWRSFLLRYLTQSDFERLPVGTFSASALGIMVAASALAHPEWLVAIIASLAYAFWIKRTRSLFAAIVAHATTNGALGAYVLFTREWQYW